MPGFKRSAHNLAPLIGLVLFALAIALVHHEIEVYHWQQIKDALAGIPAVLLLNMLIATLISYFVLSFYDYLGLEYAGEKLPYRRVLLTSFLSYAIGNNVGLGSISGGSMRYRLYSGWGIPTTSIAKTVLFCALTYGLGAITLLVAAYSAASKTTIISIGVSHNTMQSLIAAAAVLLIAWWAVVLFYRKEVSLGGFILLTPSPSLALRQLLVALAELLFASLVLYLPLQLHTGMPFSVFLMLYIASQMTGLISQVPGGIGVFEGSFLFLASNQYPSSNILAALIAYRVIYYFLPLVVAGVTLAAYELKAKRLLQHPSISNTVNFLESTIPQFYAVLLLLGGGVLLVSAHTPGEATRLQLLHHILPLPLIEFSHMVGSISGVMMLFLARAVRLRLDSAYFATLAVLGLGAIASLAKGWDFEEAIVLTVLLLIFLPTRQYFYRKSSLLSLNFPVSWIVPYLIVLGLSASLGFFTFRHVEYTHQLWWQFSLYGDASRFLRSLVAITVLSVGFTFYRLLTRMNVVLALPDSAALEHAAELVRRSSDTKSYLALLGDKYLLWSESGNSFIMFDTTRRFWIAMGDPIGDSQEHEQLAWKFREMADRHGAQVAFYEVSTRNLPLYLDLGLALLKLGEEARVPLPSFGLEGKSRQKLRHAYNKLAREAVTFEIVPAISVPCIISELQLVSEKWMQTKRAKEKGFSLGFFEEAYLCRCDVGVVKKEGRIMAFSNLWRTDCKDELSMDLMRYDPDSPNGIMEYLTISLMLWGKAQGYQWFSLGMAPLSGLEQHSLAPLWHRVGNTIFRFGGEFYNFAGLYNYKSKFSPEWQPRYLAAPKGLQIPATLLAVTALISDGIKGAIKK